MIDEQRTTNNGPRTTDNELPTRPVSVWIAQAIIFLLAAVWGLAGLVNLYVVLVNRLGITFPIVSGAVSLLCSVLFLVGFRGLVKRRAYGRWIAVGGLSLVFIAGVLNSFAAFNRYPDTAKALGAFAVGLIVFGPLGFLVYRLARGARENAFFSGTHHGDTENAGDP
jgi:hypothetical protein